MNHRWLNSIPILLTVIAVLASFPLPGDESGSTPLKLPVENEAAEDGFEKDAGEAIELGLFVCVAPVELCGHFSHAITCEDACPIDVLHDPCYGTRGPPAV